MDDLKYKFDESVLVNANNIGTHTLIGVNTTSYPIKRGNCFSVDVDGKDDISIVNFGLENLEHLLEEKVVEWPIKVLMIANKVGVFLDKRIPKDYYRENFCTICCPFTYLPLNQKLEIYGRQLRGEEVVTEVVDSKGVKYYMTSYQMNQK